MQVCIEGGAVRMVKTVVIFDVQEDARPACIIDAFIRLGLAPQGLALKDLGRLLLLYNLLSMALIFQAWC